MTTPTSNSVGIAHFNPAATGLGRYMANGTKWGGALGTGVTLDFSFQTANSYYRTSYSSYNEYDDTDSGYLTAGEKVAIRSALVSWSSVANLTFREVTDSANVAGDLRFGYTTRNGGDLIAHAYYPYTAPSAGDVWFSWYDFNPDALATIARGSRDYFVIIHEIGHALGLKHPFETPNVMPRALDNHFNTVMSYTASPFSAHGDDFATFHPTTPMYYDLLAIEAMYGRRIFANGNNVYTFQDGVKYWQAIHDTGGIDTIRYNGAEGSTIDLNPGKFSTLSEAIRFERPNGSAVFSRGTVTIGPGVTIENATGGNGNDVLIGNSAINTLTGGLGADKLTGAAGNDVLIGGIGVDTLTGGPGGDYFVFTAPPSAANRDVVADFTNVPGNNDTFRLENAVMPKLGAGAHALNPAFFRAGAALDANDCVLYNRTAGTLWYDGNGNLAGGATLLATLISKPLLTAGDFFVI